MKRKSVKVMIAIILLIVASCDEPETVVTNYVHPDGSITRRVEMRNSKKTFKKSDFQVPFDSTWSVRDSMEINSKTDTTWVKRGEKIFKNIEELNRAYTSDSGGNKGIPREATFNRRFKWFNNEYRFSERVEKLMSFGYPLNKFLNDEEIRYFYSPENLKSEKEHSSDSLKFKALSDSVKNKTDRWTTANLVSEWIGQFVKLTGGKEEKELSPEYLKSRESEMIQIVEQNFDKFDSLWKAGVILKQFVGESNALKYKTEADSAIDLVTKNFLIDFKEYSVRIVMPGKLTGTNGFIDSSKVLLWPVKSDFFLFEPYEMWAESKVPNRWAWFASGIFVLFVLTGVTIRIIKKG